ncbi:MAG: Rieske (2Fe-2S) protein [Chlorobi bacterium]|nr:Rieske (2Fe-2S) protein [Chlorobiota bacterium]
MKEETHKEVNEQAPGVESPGGRRNFIRKFWGWIGLIAGLEMTWVSLTFLNGGKKKKESSETSYTEIARAEDIPENSVFPYRAGRLYLCHLKDGGFLALSLRCTHLGCSIGWDKDQEEFRCPCHASRFSITGTVLNPPATRPLDIYPLKIDNGMIMVDLAHPAPRKSFNPGQETKA